MNGISWMVRKTNEAVLSMVNKWRTLLDNIVILVGNVIRHNRLL